MKRFSLAFAVCLLSASALSVAPASAKDTTVRIGQAVPTLSFLPIVAARALDTFKDEGLKLQFASIRGGDPAALAALDSGDIDFAAVGSDTALEAIAKGQPFEIVYSLMSQVSLDLVVSNDFLKRTGVSPSSPLKQRIQALKNATIGVSAVGGTQDRVARWLIAQGGLDPQHDVKIAMIGPPPAIHAALEHHQIDGFVLSPPEGALTEQAKTGKVLIRLGAEFPKLRSLPYLVLVAKKPLNGPRRDLAIKTVEALQAASQTTLKEPKQVADKIQQQFYKKLTPKVILDAIDEMHNGITGKGAMTQGEINRLLSFTTVTNGAIAQKLAGHAGPNSFWTDSVIDAAAKGKTP